MTNIQAIDLLKDLEQRLDDYCELNDEGKTAFRMAIEALEVFGNSEQLPSVQPEPLRINLNEWIKVKLTDLGKEIYYHQFDELNKTHGYEMIKPSFPKEDENGYSKFQLWEFIQLYGAHIGMGAPNVIDPLEIVVDCLCYEGGNKCAN